MDLYGFYVSVYLYAFVAINAKKKKKKADKLRKLYFRTNRKDFEKIYQAVRPITN